MKAACSGGVTIPRNPAWWNTDAPSCRTVLALGAEQERAAANWRSSPFFHLLQTGENLLRRRVTEESAAEFPVVKDYLAAGSTDYVAIVSRFAPEGVIGEMDCVYSSWITTQAEGFSDAQIAALTRVVPTLALAVKAAALTRMTGTLMETYLGRDAARRVLSGRIMRGVADRIDAVIWFSDLRGFTRVTDSAPEQVIPLLNDYADVIVSAIHEQGGDVLKLIGDGILAIFTAEDREHACAASLDAATVARKEVTALNARRAQRWLAGDRHVSRPACRRGVLRQYRLDRAARLHRGRTGRERSEPDRRHVPVGRAAGAGVGGFRQRRWHARPAGVGWPLRAARGRSGRRSLFTLEPACRVMPNTSACRARRRRTRPRIARDSDRFPSSSRAASRR